MKKLLVLALAVMVVFCFAACSQSAADITADTAAEIEEAIESVIEEAANEEEAISEEETEVRGELNAEFELGEVSGLNYENAFIGIGMDIPSDWIFYTDEQIKELNNAATELAGEDYEALMQEAVIVYDMYAQHKDGYNNVNVVLEKGDTAAIISTDMKDVYEASFDTTKAALENMGYTNVNFEISTVTVDGKTLDCLNTTAEMEGFPLYQKAVGIKCNGYIAMITASSYFEDTTDIVFDGMYIL